MYANYTEIEQAIANNEPFQGNSASARITSYISGLDTGRLYNSEELIEWSRNNNGDNYYVVYSYGTPMLAHVLGTAGRSRPWINTHKYSNTTSKLQNIIKRVWSNEFAI